MSLFSPLYVVVSVSMLWRKSAINTHNVFGRAWLIISIPSLREKGVDTVTKVCFTPRH